MLAGKAAEAAAVVKSFKKSRRSVLMGKYRLSGLRLVAIARASLVPGHCSFVMARLCLVDWMNAARPSTKQACLPFALVSAAALLLAQPSRFRSISAATARESP